MFYLFIHSKSEYTQSANLNTLSNVFHTIIWLKTDTNESTRLAPQSMVSISAAVINIARHDALSTRGQPQHARIMAKVIYCHISRGARVCAASRVRRDCRDCDAKSPVALITARRAFYLLSLSPR